MPTPLKTIRAPRGFRFKIIPQHQYGDIARVELQNKDGWCVGHIQLVRYDDKNVETHSSLKEEYRGKGYGNIMYIRAIQWAMSKGYKVRSGGPSDMAKRVWNGRTIRKYFQIRHRTESYGYESWLVLKAK